MLARCDVDVALIDLAMPGLDGYELARRVRENSDWDHVRLIALTGFGQQQARERSAAAGFDHHLVKPVTHADLEHVFVQH
jgi:two-component system CheB/CheR fusion protein